MYNSKYYTCEQIDQRLLEGYYDDAVAAGYTGSKAQYLAGLLQAINYSANPTITADKVAYNSASGLYKNVQEALGGIARQTSKIKGVISVSDNLDSKKESSDVGLWFISRTQDPGIVLVCRDFENHYVQVKLSATRNVSINETTNKPSIQYRKYIDNAWTEWTEIEFNILKTHILQADGITIQDTPLYGYIQHLKKTSTFAGIATPTTDPGTPDGPVFYIATEAGAYSNFGGIELESGEAAILLWDNGSWTKKVTGFATQEELLALRDLISSLYSPDKDITSEFSIITGKQAYGTVGNIIQFGSLSGAEYTVVNIEGEGVYAKFKSVPRWQVSSYLQYTDTNGIIVSRKFENIGNNVECEELIEFPEGATKCYITGAKGTISIVKKGEESIITKLTKRVDSIESSVNKYLIDKTELSGALTDVTSKYAITKGKQAYGNVGGVISFESQNILEYVAIDTDGVLVRFISENKKLGVSSYLQYVDANGIILARDFVNIGVGVECKTIIQFPPNATRAYVTGSVDTIQIFESVGRPVSIIEYIKNKVDDISEIGKLEDITVAENSKSIVDAINKACTLSITRNAHVLNKEEAFDTWGQSATNNKFLTGEVGSKISVLSGNDTRNIKIPVKDGYMITYPMFKTSQMNGSFLVDSNNTILEKFINNTEPNGTMNTVTVSGYGNKEVYFYLSLYPYSLVTQKITIQTGGEVSTEQISINKYLSKLLSNNYKENVSEEKALTTFGAFKMYEELSNKMLNDSSVLFPCKDYGVMPSCQYGDSEAFLQDGVDAEGNAIIKYSDVIAKYDELMSAYPNYIKKKELGYDASGTIPMYAYTFEPKYPTQSIYLQAGVHGWEPDPVFALAMIATLIANAYGTTDGNGLKVDDDALKYIRENVKITIVPCVNPYGFNNRADCGIDKRGQAQNNANGVQLNGAWTGNAAEAVAVRGLIEELKQELSFAIDMHSTVWEDSRSRYGCFYGGVNNGSANLLTVFKTYEWLYRFYDIKYPSIVQGDSVPNPLGRGYASIGTMAGAFNSWVYSTYGIESATMEFSDHVWTPELHTSVAMSVAVNMYLNQFIQHICARFKSITPKVDSSDIYPAKG